MSLDCMDSIMLKVISLYWTFYVRQLIYLVDRYYRLYSKYIKQNLISFQNLEVGI